MGSKLSLLVAVGGGKGGVGKSLVAANLAIACARLGLRVVAVDADLGAANLHTMFAIDRPKANLQALVTGRVRSLEEVVEPTSVPRLFLVPGSGGEEGASSIKHAQKLKLIRHIHSLEADVIVIDCGAGVSHTALDFFAMADWRLLVVTPQLVSLHNAYAFLKGAVFRSFRQLTLNARERDCLSAAIEGGAGERVDALLQRVRGQEPELALAMRHCLRHFGAAVVGNQTDGSKPSAALQAFTRMARDFLQLDVPILGNIARTDRLHHSVTQRKPFLAHSLASVEAKTFFHISEQLLALDVGRLRHERIRRPSTDRP
ncbi:MAG: MinD/ParA family ATP-binding protein, partial [Polyangiales bacterium]